MNKFLVESTKKKQAEEEMLRLTIEKVTPIFNIYNILYIIFYREIKNSKKTALKR